PLCAIVSRFYDVKGFDLIEQAMPELVQLGLQIVVIGTGDRRYEDMFRRWASELPHQVAVSVGFDAALAQRIYAGADMLWMRSRSAQKYVQLYLAAMASRRERRGVAPASASPAPVRE